MGWFGGGDRAGHGRGCAQSGAAHPEGPTSLAVTFADGSSGTVNVASALEGPIFAPLRNPARFAEGRFDPELRTIVWPNGADLAPEFLHELLSAQTPLTR